MVSLAAYLGKFFYPTGLTHRYRYPDSWPVRDVALAAAVLLLITAGAILWRRRVSATCLSAGSGTWGCWCRCSGWCRWDRNRWPTATRTCR